MNMACGIVLHGEGAPSLAAQALAIAARTTAEPSSVSHPKVRVSRPLSSNATRRKPSEGYVGQCDEECRSCILRIEERSPLRGLRLGELLQSVRAVFASAASALCARRRRLGRLARRTMPRTIGFVILGAAAARRATTRLGGATWQCLLLLALHLVIVVVVRFNHRGRRRPGVAC